MTFKQIKEMLLVYFPAIGETAAGILVNNATELFGAETRLYTKSAKIIEFNTTPTYTVKTATQLSGLIGKVFIAGTNSTIDGVSLPTDIDHIYRVDFYDSDRAILSEEYAMPWGVEHANLFLGNNSDTALRDGIVAVVINYYAIPETMVGDNDTPPFQNTYHQAILHKAIELTASGLGNLDLAKTSGFQYRELRKEAKRAAKMAGDYERKIENAFEAL
jgi:hypothetical protein